MSWQVFEVTLRLAAPMHIGWKKVGNLQMTRRYVTGRVLWGAFTQRLTREALLGKGSACDSRQYRAVGDEVNRSLAFTYFYVSRQEGGAPKVIWPWEDDFRSEFLGSCMSTARVVSAKSAEEASLHDIEYIASRTASKGERVFLTGYVFVRNGGQLKWQDSLRHFQLGGERTYGWGSFDRVSFSRLDGPELFNGEASVGSLDQDRPIVKIQCAISKPGLVLAHTDPGTLEIRGTIEPLVGREWRSDSETHRFAGQYVECNGVYFCPGAEVRAHPDQVQDAYFAIHPLGIWRACSSPS